MGNLLESLGASIKAVAAQRLPFSRYYGGGGYGSGAWSNYGLTSFPGIIQAGAGLNYEELAGDPLTNSVVARCVECIANALSDAPPYLEHREKGQWVRVDEHAVLDLLRYPNPYHSDAEVWGLVVAGERVRGRAYWYLAWDDTRPREIWPVPPERVTVLGNEEEFISGYRVQTESGRVIEVGEEQIIHFRHLVNPWNPREGWSPLETGKRQIAGDNAAASYHASILRNSGVLSLLVAVKEGASSGSVTPEQMDGFVKALQRKLFGEGAGGIAGLNLPLDVHRMSYSPDEMSLDRLISYYETRICVLLGVDPMVAGVGSGTAQKTYANLGEALNDFWVRTVVPMHNRHASVLTAQLLPLFGLEASEWRLRFDYSQVSALRENKDGLHARVREDYRAGVIDLWTAQSERGMQPLEEYRGRFYGDAPGSGGGEVKSWKEWRESERARGESGPGTNSGSFVAGGSRAGVGQVNNANNGNLTTSYSAPERWERPPGWRLPKNGSWSGTPGHSDFIPHHPNSLGLESGDVVPFYNGMPDFSKWSKYDLRVTSLDGKHGNDMPLIRKELAIQLEMHNENGQPIAEYAKLWLQIEELIPHHAGGDTVQLIPAKLHGGYGHKGVRHMGGAFGLRTASGEIKWVLMDSWIDE